MTPVDIDKLKELQRLLSDGEWWQTVTRGPNPTSFTSDMTHVARQAAALIAKAERVDAMERALERAADALEAARDAFEETWVGTGDPEDHAAKVIADIELTAARNALSPKEYE